MSLKHLRRRMVEAQVDIVCLPAPRDAHWPLRAARELGHLISWPGRYLRATSRVSLNVSPPMSSTHCDSVDHFRKARYPVERVETEPADRNFFAERATN